MILVDSTIVNVALATIKADLAFSDWSLVWIVNAYLLTYSGFLLLAGRLGDIFGQRRTFLLGIVLFTVASVGCGLAESAVLLVVARALQGLGGAIITAVALALTVNLFPEGRERAKALSASGMIAAGGGSVGLLLGGTLTSAFNWRWIFLINLPVGVAMFALGVALLPSDREPTLPERSQVGAALAGTASLMLAVYGIVGGNKAGWTSMQTITPFVGSAALALAFILIEARAQIRLVPFALFRHRNFRVASAALALVSISVNAWYFFVTLYLQLVLGWKALMVGLAFLPAYLLPAGLSAGLSANLVGRFGLRAPLAIGLLLTTLGLLLFAHMPLHGTWMIDILPGMILMGLGSNLTSIPLFMMATTPVSPSDSGLASGFVNTSFTMGGSIGLAVLVSIAEARTNHLVASGYGLPIALTGGYHLALLFGGCISAITLACLVFFQDSSDSKATV
jgi:EmrB/QacA subfamily drug resistance transporter